MRIVIKTLVDITKTGVRRKEQGDALRMAQQSNFQTLQQIINIRSLIEDNADPYVTTEDVSGKFGKRIQGEHKVWTYEFVIDRDDVYNNDKDPIGFLKEDFHNVPIIGSLNETINIPSAFKVNKGDYTNIIFECFDK
jgi:hypothetical protein